LKTELFEALFLVGKMAFFIKIGYLTTYVIF